MKSIMSISAALCAAAAVFADDTEVPADEAATNDVSAVSAPQDAAFLALGKIETRVFKLNHVSASEIAEKFNSMWNGEFGQQWKVTRMAVPFEDANTVMVTAPKPNHEACEKAVAVLDVEAPQVYVEARFVELSNDVHRDLGIDWSMLDGMRGSVTFGGGIQSHKLGGGVKEYTKATGGSEFESTRYQLTGKDGDISFYNGTLNFNELYLVLYALEGNEDARIFSNPKIIVTSGKKATVDMTTKYPNVKISAKRTTGASGSDSLDLDMQMAQIPGEDKMMFAKEAFFSWGISLDVTPRISTNGLINVTIVPTISDRSDWVTAGTTSADEDGTISAKYPVISMQRLITEFSMSSGTTAVIGGLSRTVEEQVDNGIPFLSKIPWIGDKLFGSKMRKKLQKEIIVFVTVGMVDPRGMDKEVGLPKNAILGRQYTKGQKLEPGDVPEELQRGPASLDLRSLEEQAKDPLPVIPPTEENAGFKKYIPFTKDPTYRREEDRK